jgi:hypothetical protein
VLQRPDRAGRVISSERLNQIETRPRSGAQLFGRAYEEHKPSPLSVVDPLVLPAFLLAHALALRLCDSPKRGLYSDWLFATVAN